MDTILEILFGRTLIRFLGIWIRYYILRIFNKNLTIEQLKGKDDEGFFYNDFINSIIGFISFAIIAIGFAYLYYTYLD